MSTRQYLKIDKLVLGQISRGSRMAIYVDLSPYWKDSKNPTIEEAKRKTGLDKRTLSSAKKGHLDRGQFETLMALRDFASELAGKHLSVEDILKKVEETAS